MADVNREPLRWPDRLMRMVYGIATAMWWLLAVGLVLLALYTGIGRQITQHIDDFRPRIAAQLSAALGQEVTIDQLTGRWEWLDPVVEARNVRVGADGAALGHLRLRFDSLTSLLRLKIVLAELEADSFDLTVERKADGSLAVDGFSSSPGSAAKTPHVSHWLDIADSWLSDPAIRITRVNLGIRNAGELQHIDIPQLDLRYERGLFLASGRAVGSGTTEQLASFALRGKHFFRGDFDGQIYIDINSGRVFDGLLEQNSWRGLRVVGMDLGGRAWLTFEHGQLQRLNGKMRTPYLQLDAGNKPLAPIENLTTNFGWKRLDSKSPLAGELHFSNLSWQWLEEETPGFDLVIKHTGEEWVVGAQRVPLRPLATLVAAMSVLPDKANKALVGYQPAGTLNNLVFTMPQGSDGEFRLEADLNNISAASHNGAPQGRGLNGEIVVDHQGGTVRVDSADVEVGFPDLFLHVWNLRQLTAEVSWALEGPVARVFSDNIHVDYGDDTRFSGGFDLRFEQGSESNLSLRVVLENGTAAMLADFVPARVVSPQLYEWLTTAVTAADIEYGEYYGHGQISTDTPLESFTSSMFYRFRAASVQYDENWPRITQAQGLVSVRDTNAHIAIDAGETGGLKLDPSVVEVITGPEGVNLKINTSAPFNGADVPYWLANSPLQERAGEAAENLAFAGQYQLNLGLDIPLGRAQEPQVKVDLSTSNGALSIPAAGLVWDQISGNIVYSTARGFNPDRLSARFMGKPVTVDFAENPDTGKVSVSQEGKLTVADITAALDFPEGTDPGASGSLSYIARLNVAADPVTSVSVYSSLVGIDVGWPQPLTKIAKEPAPLRAVIDWGNREGILLAGVWDQRFAFRLLWDRGNFDRGRVVFGSQAAELPGMPGLILAGSVKELDISAWGQSISRLFTPPDQKNTRTPEVSGLAGSGSVERWLNTIELSVAQLAIAGQVFPHVDIAARLLSGRWLIDSESERAAGRITLPLSQNEPVTIDYRRLRLVAGSEEPASGAPELTREQQIDAFRALAMEGWPNVDVNIDSLLLGDGELGRWVFSLRPEADVLVAESIQGTLGSLRFNGDLRWGIESDTETTRLSGNLTGGNLGDLSRLMDDEFPLSSKKTDLELDLEWPGRPEDFTLAQLSGDARVRLDNGKILKNNKSAQLFRIFNILNADNLWRRLKLDFSDLYEAGVAFDAFSGKALLQSGVFRWDPELQIVGPSGAFKVSGMTNLEDETLDMRLVVVLPLTQNLPLAALLMGASAPIGGALFMLDKVLGDPLSKLTSATYNVKGTWSNPDVRLKGVFDTGN